MDNLTMVSSARMAAPRGRNVSIVTVISPGPRMCFVWNRFKKYFSWLKERWEEGKTDKF